MTYRSELLGVVVGALDSVGIDYMVVGSLAASAHGFERTTHDFDIVVVLDGESISALAEALGDGFYFDVEGAREAAERSDMFNVIHYESGFKIDFWMLKSDEFAQGQFARRLPTEVMGVVSHVESPEDTILSKLLWYKITPSERQLSDAKGILILQKDRLDYDYLRGWARELGVADLLESVES